MTLETQEPITTIEPILGLGEDYEPETVWIGGNPHRAPKTAPFSHGIAYDSKDACEAFSDVRPQRVTVPEVIQRARRQGVTGVIVLDKSGQPVASWPV